MLFSMTSSCTDEDIQRSYTATDGIAFTPSIETRSWSTGDGTTTRTTVPVTRHSVMKLNNAQGGRDLYLHTTETDSIAAPLANDTAHIATRGAVVTTDNFGVVYEGFGVLAYAYQGEWDVTQSPNYIDNEQATKTGETYGFNPVRVWPGNAYRMAFFAYAPYDETGKIFNETIGAPTLAYTVPTDITKQSDLLACWQTDISGDKREAQQLKFSHLCTAVKFKVGDGLENAVTSISIQNVYGSGTYSVDDAKWTATGDANGTYTFAIEEEKTPADAELTNGESVFMMIPQELPEDAMIEVKYKSEGGQEKEYTAGIGGKEWQKGHTVVYTLSKTEIIETAHFTVEAAEIDYRGGTLTYKVTSYTETSVDGAVTITPTAWKITGYQESGSDTWNTTAPDWITGLSTSGNGSTTAEEQTAKIAAQKYNITNPHNDALKSASPVKGIYDLSTQGDTEPMNTANCYVINAPGKYSLPLVYGNAIKDGQTNTSAYVSPAASADDILQNLVNHAGNPITDPYIYNNVGCEPDNATLVWQDSPDLVTNVKLSSDDEPSLTFEVSKVNIAQGNAVIAVRNSNDEILWSWHIWVTDYVPGKEADKDAPMKDKVVTNNQNNEYTFMAVYLGYCGNTENYYEGRSVKVRFEQEGTGETQTIEFTQTQHSVSHDNWNVPYYQWGRKEPMLPAQSHHQIVYNKKWYDAAGRPSTSWTYSKADVDEIWEAIPSCIKNPGKMIKVSVWMVYLYRNLWNASPNDNSVVKTVYDPSPVGYHIPPKNAFSGFTYNGKDYDNDSWAQFNSPFDSERDLYDNDETWVFYCNKMKGQGEYDAAGGTISFPCADRRSVTDIDGSMWSGYTWTASCVRGDNASYSAYCMSLGTGSVSVNDTNEFLYGLPVRPVRETE